MVRTFESRVGIACALCAALLPALASADARRHPRKPARMHALVVPDAPRRGCTVADALASQQAPASIAEATPVEAAVAAEASRSLPAVTQAHATNDAWATQPTLRVVERAIEPARYDAGLATIDMPARQPAPLRFFDRDSLRSQIESIRRLPLVHLFDNRQMSIYLGIDRKGVAGLHLQQRRPDEFVPMDEADAPVDVPLRSVPLDAR